MCYSSLFVLVCYLYVDVCLNIQSIEGVFLKGPMWRWSLLACFVFLASTGLRLIMYQGGIFISLNGCALLVN